MSADPRLASLGFAFTVQAGIPTATGHRQPDYALFTDEDLRSAADLVSGAARYANAAAVADAKRFDRRLDRRKVAPLRAVSPAVRALRPSPRDRC